MWMFLLACTALDALTAADVDAPPSAIPGPVYEGHVAYAVVVDAPGRPPWSEALPSLDDILDPTRAPHPLDVTAALLDPSHPWSAAARQQRATETGWADLLEASLTTERACRGALEDADTPWSMFLSCPVRMRTELAHRFADVPEASPAFAPTPLPNDLAAAFTQGTMHPSFVLEDHPEAAARIADAADACARDAGWGAYATSQCVAALAAIDWTRAVAHADALEADDPLRVALQRFPDDEAVDAHLDALGFTGPPSHGALPARLHQRGWATSPSLIAEDLPLVDVLLSLGVQGVTVQTLLPRPGNRAMAVYAYRDGQRTRVLLDLYLGADLEQVIAFANVLARRQELPHRAVWGYDQGLPWVAFGPTEGLEALIDDGLLRPEPPTVRWTAEAVDTGPTDAPQ